jgi:WD40 repeat protein
MRYALITATAMFVCAGLVQAAPGDLLQTFANPTPEALDRFGYSVAASGMNALVGAPADNTVGVDAGAVYLLDSTSGNVLTTFLNPFPGTGDNFGYSVAGVGGNILAGAPKDTGGGSAYLFDSTGNLLHSFSSPSPVANGLFGQTVASAGNDILIAAPREVLGPSQTGSVYLYDGSTGSLLQSFSDLDQEVDNGFGFALAAANDRVFVGDPFSDTGEVNAGVVRVFDLNTGQLLHTIENPSPGYSDRFGYSLATYGDDHVIVGAYLDDAQGAEESGTVYMFDAGGNLIRTFENPNPSDEDRFGHSVAVVNNTLVVGASWEDFGATDAGAAYLFDIPTGSLLSIIENPTPEAGDVFGRSLAALGQNVLIGAQLDHSNGIDPGAVFLFDPVPEPATMSLLALGGVALLKRRRVCR